VFFGVFRGFVTDAIAALKRASQPPKYLQTAPKLTGGILNLVVYICYFCFFFDLRQPQVDSKFQFFFDLRQPQVDSKFHLFFRKSAKIRLATEPGTVASRILADLRLSQVERIQKNYTLTEFGRDPVARAARPCA